MPVAELLKPAIKNAEPKVMTQPAKLDVLNPVLEAPRLQIDLSTPISKDEAPKQTRKANTEKISLFSIHRPAEVTVMGGELRGGSSGVSYSNGKADDANLDP